MMCADSIVPELLPARMLNEYVYCQRLFYLEWVDQRWADNDDTAEGAYAHRDVDSRAGRAPDPGDPSWPKTTRSVRIEDEDLGLVAVIDRVDHEGGLVSPVDYKKGSPQRDGSPWPADRMQVLAQAALLRGAGYSVSSAYLYYATTHARVEVSVSDETDAEVRMVVQHARETAGADRAPAPLMDSPKCPRCSLASICLPDETNLLLARRTSPARRIIPRDPDSRPLYVTEPGARVGVRHGSVVVTKHDDVIAQERLIDVSHLAVVGNVQVSTQALTRFWGAGVTVLYLSYGGWLNGWSQGAPSKFVHLRRTQARHDEFSSLHLAASIVAGKVKNQRVMLRRNTQPAMEAGVLEALRSLSLATESATTRAELMGIEGTAARLYFQHFPSLLRDAQVAQSFARTGRNRRPPRDPVNSALSFVYALLTKDLVATCIGAGLDPYLGVLHADRFGRPSMALDLAEEFRPLIADSVVVQCFNTGVLHQDRDFIRRAGAVQLTKDARRSLIKAYERRLDATVRHPIFKYTISYRRVLDVQARLLASALVGEVSGYTAMVTR